MNPFRPTSRRLSMKKIRTNETTTRLIWHGDRLPSISDLKRWNYRQTQLTLANLKAIIKWAHPTQTRSRLGKPKSMLTMLNLVLAKPNSLLKKPMKMLPTPHWKMSKLLGKLPTKLSMLNNLFVLKLTKPLQRHGTRPPREELILPSTQERTWKTWPQKNSMDMEEEDMEEEDMEEEDMEDIMEGEISHHSKIKASSS